MKDDASTFIFVAIMLLIAFMGFVLGVKFAFYTHRQTRGSLEQEYLRSVLNEDKDAWIKKYAEQKKAAYEAVVKCNKHKKHILLTVTTFNPDGSFNDYDIKSVNWTASPIKNNENNFVRFVASSLSPEEGRVFEINSENWLFPTDGKDR